MRVLVVFPTIRGGGAERTVITIFNYLVEQRGYNVDYFVFDSSNFYADIISAKSKLTNANIHYGVNSYLDKANTFLRAGIKLKEYLQNNKYDLVVSGVEQESEWAIAFAKRFHTFTAISILHTQPKYWNLRNSFSRSVFLHLLNSLRKKLFAGIIFISDIIFNSTELGDNQLAVTIPPAIDSKMIKELAVDDKSELFTDTPFLLNPARFNYQKNQNLLLRAFLKIIDKVAFKLIFVGEGVKNLESFVDVNSHNSNKIYFFESIKNPFSLINKASAVILTSRYEGVPLVLMESAVLNTPVICSKYSGYDKLFRSDYQYIFESENEEELIMLLLKFNEDLLKGTIQNNPIDYHEFEVEHCAEQYHSFISKVLNG